MYENIRQIILQQARSEQIDRREIGALMRTVMERELMNEHKKQNKKYKVNRYAQQHNRY